MPSCEVLVTAGESTSAAPLASAWVYIQEGGTTTTYRTAPNGRLRKLAPGGTAADGTRPWKFETKALLDVPKTVRVYASKGARPIPQSVLDNTVFNNAQAYVERTIALPVSAAPVAIASTDATVVAISVAQLAAPQVTVALTQPKELSLCPILWDHAPEHETDDSKDYLRAGLPQEAATPEEGAAPAQPPGGVVVHERGVRFKGTIGNNAQHVRIRVAGPTGALLGLRASATGSRVEQLQVATAGTGAERTFEANLWFDEPTQAFGLAHVVIDSSDTSDSRHFLDSFTVFLVGLQLAMVDDSTANLDGSSAGQLANQAQEKVVLSFKNSPVRDVASSNLFLHAYKVRTQAESAVNQKKKRIEEVRTAFTRLKKPRDTAAKALETAVAQTSAAQAKEKLTVAKAKLTAFKTAVTSAAPGAKVTAALLNTPERETTADAAFNVAMQELAAAFTAVNAQLSPPCTAAMTSLTAALTAAEQQLDAALTQVAIELTAAAAPAAKTAANAARIAATSAATTQLQTIETAQAAGLTAATEARDLLAAPAGAKQALQHADTRKAALLDEAKAKATAELTKKRRARRMVRYAIRGDQTRKFGGTGPVVPHPQMPMFMAELQVFGVEKSPLEELLVRRKRSEPAAPGLTQALRLEVDWRLRFKWKGPDVDPPTDPPAEFQDGNAGGYTLNQEFRGVWTATKLQAVAQGVVLTLGEDETLGVEGDAVRNAFAPVPVKLPFPVETRRVPLVAIANRQRAWGRGSGAKSGAAMVVEWQVPVVDSAGREILRGGDGLLTVASLKLDGERIDRGTSATVDSAQSDLQLVPFRVSGDNVPANAVDAADPVGQMIEAVVGQAYEALAAGHVARSINVAGWKLAYRRTVAHESRARQFNGSTSTDFRHWEGKMVWSYGQEKGMPLHGHPHGFTMAQCDPHPSDDAMWSYLEAIRAGAKVLFAKAVVAKSDLEHRASEANAAYAAKLANGTATAQDQDPAASLDLTIAKHREALLRGAVKRYNGGQEFLWGHPAGYVAPAAPATPPPMSWVISPKPKNDYPNAALGTSVNYSHAEPIEFTQFVLPATP